MERGPLTLASFILLGLLLIVASLDHRGYMELCVCVVNALSRGFISLVISIIFGLVPMVFEHLRRPATAIVRYAGLLQILAFVVTLFFLTQYVLFLLEIIV
ncbi:MAG: hypothetical protein M3R08_05670 [Bacteroidota bacterium]|nr:hypothetical protein [Bacteroidota bacterium]